MNDEFQAMHRLLSILQPLSRQQILGQYTASLTDFASALENQLQVGERSQAQALAHKLAGSAAMMQDQQLSGPMRALERLLVEGRVEEAQRAWPAVRAAVQRTRKALAGLSG